ncbi:unnamed protein product, partial [Discosporangium mesarthrocarpum]
VGTAEPQQAGFLQVVEALIEMGADVNAPSPGRDFLLPLHYAAMGGSGTVVEALLGTGRCEVDARTGPPGRLTPLAIAVGRGRAGAVRALLEHGADPDAEQLQGNGFSGGDKSLVHLASHLGRPDIVRLLLEALAFKRAATAAAAVAEAAA